MIQPPSQKRKHSSIYACKKTVLTNILNSNVPHTVEQLKNFNHLFPEMQSGLCSHYDHIKKNKI